MKQLALAFLICLSIAANSDTSCPSADQFDILLRKIHERRTNLRDFKQVSEAAIQIILEEGQRLIGSVSGQSSSRYERMLINAAAEGNTIHRFARIESTADWIFTLPAEGTTTVFDILSPDGRLHLAKSIEAIYAAAQFDWSILTMDRERSDNAFDTLTTQIKGVGFSPKIYLAVAQSGDQIGVCRDAACGFAGNLGELGWPEDWVRLVIASKRSNKGGAIHVWVEIRVEENGPWIELDPTPPLFPIPGTRTDALKVFRQLIATMMGRTYSPASVYPNLIRRDYVLRPRSVDAYTLEHELRVLNPGLIVDPVEGNP